MSIKKDTAEAWLKIAVQEIKDKINKLKVRDTGALFNSVHGSIQEISGGDAYKASLLYNYYGIFPDMGVGKGIQKGDANVGKLLGFKRKAKPWTREIAAQRHRFKEVMTTAYADEAIKSVEGSLLKKIEFKS